MTPAGPEQQLLITICTVENTAGGLKKQSATSWPQFRFAWQLEPPDIAPALEPPSGILTYGVCLVFMVKPPHQFALFNHKPCHEDNPRFILLKDKEM